MEGISRKDLDEIVRILMTDVKTEDAKRLAGIIRNYDIIPKLYAYTYFKKVFDELKNLKGEEKSIDIDELETLANENEKLQLNFINTKTEANKILQFLNQGFERESQFCDFADSKFDDKTQIGSCQCEDHYEDIEQPLVPLTEKQQKIFDKICETNNRYQAILKFSKNYNPDNQVLKPVYLPDESSHKYIDEPQWFCKACIDRLDGDCDVSVSCDMDDDL